MFIRLRDFFIITIVSLLLMEGILRIVLFSDLVNIPPLQKPWRYAYQDTDDLWKLQYLWSKQLESSSPSRIHPSLGWSQTDVSEENPLGLQSDTLQLLKPDNRSKILFYGDSFVKGASEPEYHIPRYMNERMPGADVIDLGVPGYGTDQIFLLFKETFQKVNNSLVIVGVLLGDIDRTILSFRTSQKPYFSIGVAGDLVLNGIPVEKDQRNYLDAHPPSIYSYALAMIFKKLSLFRPDFYLKKKQINRRIIERINVLTDNHGLELVYVIFYGRQNLERLDWREEFLKSELTKRGISFVDTKPRLITHAEKNNIPLSSLYVQNEGHHNNLGNQVIAESILNYLQYFCENRNSEVCNFAR